MRPEQLLDAETDSEDRPPNTGNNVQLVTPQLTAASRQPAGYDAAAPGSASTAWVDLDIPTTPLNNPVEVDQPCWRHAQLQGDPREACSASQAHQRSVAGRVSSKGAAAPGLEVTPSGHAGRLQHTLSLGASPIDLLTPSTGAASTVATPTFSEMSEVCDLTQS